jgi:hypothetical protein
MGERRLSIAAATSFHVSLRIQGTSPHRRFHSLLTLKLLPHHRSISQPASQLTTTTSIIYYHEDISKQPLSLWRSSTVR